MEKNKRWHFGLIITVIALTLYSILPTVFYYSKPLSIPIDNKQAQEIAHQISDRFRDQSENCKDFIKSYCNELGLKKVTIINDESFKDVIKISFQNENDLNLFKSYFQKAKATTPSMVGQIEMLPSEESEKFEIFVTNNLGLASEFINSLTFQPLFDGDKKLDPAFIDYQVKKLQSIVNQLVHQEPASLITEATQDKEEINFRSIDLLSQHFLKVHKALVNNTVAYKRSLAAYTQGSFENKTSSVKKAVEKLELLKEKVKAEKIALQEEENKQTQEKLELAVYKKEQLNFLKNKEESLLQAIALMKKNQQLLSSGKKLPTQEVILSIANQLKPEGQKTFQKASLQGLNPLFEAVSFDWMTGKFELHPYADLENTTKGFSDVEQLLLDEVKNLNLALNQDITPIQGKFVLNFFKIENAKSLLKVELSQLESPYVQSIKNKIETFWKPHSALGQELKSSLLITSDSSDNKTHVSSFFVTLKNGLELLKAEGIEENTKQLFLEDIAKLQNFLHTLGFYISSSAYNEKLDPKDIVFENRHFISHLIEASKENFVFNGAKGTLELQFSDLKQRIFSLNKIEASGHEELVKWKNDYFSALNHPHRELQPFYVKPIKNTLFSNFKLNLKKYFRGDERKVLNWGLDLSGGKTVDIAFYDHLSKKVTDEANLKIAINELYSRVNKLGVSEVSIRQEGDHVTVDFPGSQHLSARELIQASSMTFNLVNEKFSQGNPLLSEQVNRFLQEVWNQAVINQTQDVEQLNSIAQDLLYGDGKTFENAKPRTESAKVLLQNGLVLGASKSSLDSLDMASSKIIPYKQDSKFSNPLVHQLMIVFSENALEGSNLENIHSGFDSKDGNYLSFAVKKSATNLSGEKFNPQNHLAKWTEKFSVQSVKGTEFATFTRGHGYRMAVILNGQIVSSPSLNAAIKENGQITGQFSLRDVQKLEADLKAGSLTFNPKILSEKNVSPDLGDQERSLGIMATFVALFLVVATMIIYYRFAGLVAAVAVIFNLLIMWAVLQNIQATLTLAGLAGVVLTVGMAVDANVLVFERIKEELQLKNKLMNAIESGYSKAFSAIIDSNLTTILAALVLLNFDSGPVKGFAVTLIIGVASSMFTALFATRFFFRSWVKYNPQAHLTMMSWIKAENINFIRYFKPAFFMTVALIGAGVFFAGQQKEKLFGMDFTGGYAFNLNIKQTPNLDYKGSVEKALESAGIAKSDFTIRELSEKNQLKVFFSKAINFQPVSEKELSDALVDLDPKLVSFQKLLSNKGIELSSSALAEMKNSFNQVSGQMSEAMRDQAIIGITIALLGILLYISIRFEFKFALASTLGLGVDILITLALVAILNAFGLPLQIDLNMVAALLTIVGYSLNDTIIVFDRIREELKKNPHLTLKDITNSSLNLTLSRTLLTSGTTLLVLVALVVLGGASIFSFAFVMAIGVFIGTLSTFYVATPLLLYLERKNKRVKRILASTSP